LPSGNAEANTHQMQKNPPDGVMSYLAGLGQGARARTLVSPLGGKSCVYA